MDIALTEAVAAVSSNLNVAYSKQFTATGSAYIEVTETIAASQTDSQVNIAIDVSAVKWFLIHSTTAVTVETNSGSAAADTLTLLAGYAYEWHASRYDAFKLGTDVTALFITTTAEAIVTIKVLYDSTP